MSNWEMDFLAGSKFVTCVKRTKVHILSECNWFITTLLYTYRISLQYRMHAMAFFNAHEISTPIQSFRDYDISFFAHVGIGTSDLHRSRGSKTNTRIQGGSPRRCWKKFFRDFGTIF